MADDLARAVSALRAAVASGVLDRAIDCEEAARDELRRIARQVEGATSAIFDVVATLHDASRKLRKFVDDLDRDSVDLKLFNEAIRGFLVA